MNFERLSSRENQSGQIVVLLIISLLTMMLTVSLLFNTGQQLHLKTKVQNSVDSGVISHGTNVARALNVMSVNNVGITQAFTLNVLMANLVPELTASTYTAIEGVASYTQGVARYCPNYFTLGGGFLDPSPEKIKDAHEVVEALEIMNTLLYENFSNSSATAATRLGLLNDLTEAPLFVAGEAFYINKEPDLVAPNVNSTWLPIEKTVTLESGSPPVLSQPIGAGVQDLSLCLTGYKGTPLDLPRAFWNFQQHGYPIGEGPFVIGRHEFNAVIERQVDNIEQMPEEIPGATLFDVDDRTDFEDLVNIAYPLACSLQRLMKVELYVPLPSSSFTLYKTSLPVFDISSQENSNWSIFAIARHQQSSGVLGSDLFKDPIKAHYAYAQAEIYNPVFYDLYTQDWTVKMQPASFIVNLHPDFIDFFTAPEHYPELESALHRDFTKYNSH